MKITKRQLRRIIREAIDIVDATTGEVFEFGPEGIPDEAWPDLQRRLGITPIKPSSDADVAYAADPGGIEVSSEDFHKLTDEVEGKRWKRKRTADERRLNPIALLHRLDKWAEDAGSEYAADNPGTDMQDVARDLAASAEYQFEQDEWDALIDDFDYDEDALLSYIADTIAG